ncbi:MAG: hypothetical protein CMF31_05010 [Kordiimonas sp.]|nr:hypothetical protein [Kordiimonas sp.]
MTQAIFYDPVTGHIESIRQAVGPAPYRPDGLPYILSDENVTEKYVDLSDPDNPLLVDRVRVTPQVDKNDIEAGGDEAHISGLPDSCYLYVAGDVREVIGGEAVIASDAPDPILCRLVGRYICNDFVIKAHDLAALREKIKAQIDADAEAARLKYTTAGSTQAMVYEHKHKEAQAVQAVLDAGANPVASDYPILNAESAATNTTLTALAAVVIGTAQQWAVLAGQIEALRISAKMAVDVAMTPAEIIGIKEIDWP